MKIVVCPDKFKGSASASEISQAIRRGALLFDNSIEVLTCPLADGGEGSLEVLNNHLSLDTVKVNVHDPIGRSIESKYLTDGNQAFIEMAKASGLQLLNPNEYDSTNSSSFGTGQLINHAILNKIQKIYLFIGGSATTDCAIGMASALGFDFLDKEGNILQACGGSMQFVNRIIPRNVSEHLHKTEFVTISDVKNPLFGHSGAAHVYSAQKGASVEEIKHLDQGLRNMARVIKKELNVDISQIEGSGAAGGVGGGTVAFFNSTIKSGIETIFEISKFNKIGLDADLLITGEGKLDGQSLDGKVISGVRNFAIEHNIKWGCICGIIDGKSIQRDKIGATFLSDIVSLANSLEESKTNVLNLVEEATVSALKRMTTI